MNTPIRVQLSRKKGWRMPANTIKVDRTTKWGNPFIVGVDGSAVKCVYWLIMRTCGYMLLSCSRQCCERQRAFYEVFKKEAKGGYPTLRGKNLACWCKEGEICHADYLLLIANKPRKQKVDIVGFLAKHGWKMVDGKAVRIAKQ